MIDERMQHTFGVGRFEEFVLEGAGYTGVESLLAVSGRAGDKLKRNKFL